MCAQSADPLPVHVDYRPGQALDSYLEGVADANHISPAMLLTRLRGAGGQTRYLTYAPAKATLAVASAMTGQVPEILRAATLHAWDHVAYDLSGFDPARQATIRQVASRGWAPWHTSQICPACLAGDGAWQLMWRLPTATVCVHHQAYLLSVCPTCARPFRSNRHSPLRRVGSTTVCGNPLGQGPQAQCQQRLHELQTTAADAAAVQRQQRHDAALAGQAIPTWAGLVQPTDYFAESKSLATLLLHLASQPGALESVDFAADLAPECIRRTLERGPRWGLAPPSDTRVRSAALSAAERILATPDLDAAVVAFRPWYDLTPATPEGPLGWLADHTRMTPHLTQLVMATHAPRRRLAARLDRESALLPTHAIPQMIPADLYQRHVADLMGCTPTTGRIFVSLAIARTQCVVHTWKDAAERLSLPSEIGVSVARAVDQRRRGSPEQLHGAVLAVAADLDPHVSWRLVESSIRFAALRPEGWWRAWAERHHPGMRSSSVPFAITWRWLHEARGAIATSPAWPGPPTAKQRARYRQFETTTTKHTEGGSGAMAFMDAERDRLDRKGTSR